MKYTILLLSLLASLASFGQSNTFYNPDAEPDGQIGSSDLLEFLPLFGNEFTPDTCMCGCPAGNELGGLVAGDTLLSYDFAALVFQENAEYIELTIHLNSYGIGQYPFLGDTLIEYPCFTYTQVLPKNCYNFDTGQVVYSDGNTVYCGETQARRALHCDDTGVSLGVTWPNVNDNGDHDNYWQLPAYCNFVQSSDSVWVMTPDGFSEIQPPAEDCFNFEGEQWDICYRLYSIEVRFID